MLPILLLEQMPCKARPAPCQRVKRLEHLHPIPAGGAGRTHQGVFGHFYPAASPSGRDKAQPGGGNVSRWRREDAFPPKTPMAVPLPAQRPSGCGSSPLRFRRTRFQPSFRTFPIATGFAPSPLLPLFSLCSGAGAGTGW